MKKVILSYLVSALALVSCSKDQTATTSSSTTQEIAVSATPTTITNYISENYPDASISYVLKYSNSDTAYAVTLNTFEFLSFNDMGTPLGESMADTLCDSIPDPRGGGHHGGGHHGGGHHGGGHHGGGGPHGGGIPADSIPAAITEYVAAHFAGYTVHNAKYDTLCQFGIIMNVMIDSSYSVHHKLIFDASGVFLAQAHRFNSSDLPAAVAATLASGFSAYTLREKAELYVLADMSKEYRVFLHLNGIHLSAVLKEDGTLVCQQ
ncbi:MAG: hypothetical protein WCR72_02230 [Bacteroidota bacterium]